VVFLDGLCKINASILICEIYLLVLVLAIIHLQAIYSRRPELYLLILSNVLGLIYMISSNDWLITVVAWELFNLLPCLIIRLDQFTIAFPYYLNFSYLILSTVSFSARFTFHWCCLWFICKSMCWFHLIFKALMIGLGWFNSLLLELLPSTIGLFNSLCSI